MKKNIFLAIGLIALALTFAIPVMAVEPKKKIVDIEYETPDKYVVRAKLMYPLEIKDKYPMVVLLHSLGYSSAFWQALPDAFNQAGFAVLKLDFKGHGMSAADIYFKKRSWIYMSEATFKSYPDDVYNVLKIIFKEHKDIAPNFISFVGADIGANTAIITSEKLTYKPVCMVLIAPSISFKGLYTPIKYANAGAVDTLAIATEQDSTSIKQLPELKKYAQGNYETKIYKNGGMGMLVIKLNPDMPADIANWVVGKVNEKLLTY